MAVTDAIKLEAAAYPPPVAFDSLWINHYEEGTRTRLSLADLGAGEN